MNLPQLGTEETGYNTTSYTPLYNVYSHNIYNIYAVLLSLEKLFIKCAGPYTLYFNLLNCGHNSKYNNTSFQDVYKSLHDVSKNVYIYIYMYIYIYIYTCNLYVRGVESEDSGLHRGANGATVQGIQSKTDI